MLKPIKANLASRPHLNLAAHFVEDGPNGERNPWFRKFSLMRPSHQLHHLFSGEAINSGGTAGDKMQKQISDGDLADETRLVMAGGSDLSSLA
ncbi:unnamed protein product [Linum trigynum]|uniref:Uncharacterized protein n=1 Tax=Linum trigynum TaxID=586398 RepID=A0AAV2E9P8_9ROSI